MSESSLRDALEKLVKRNNYPDGHVMTAVLESLLADHPAEPVGVSGEPACDCYRRVPPEKHTSWCSWGRWHLAKEAGLLPERSVGVSDEAVERVAATLHGFEHDRLHSRCPGSDECELWYDADVRARHLFAAPVVLALMGGAER